MNDPIDILEIAERRYANALTFWRQVRTLGINGQMSMGAMSGAAVDVARDDLWRARRLSNDVTLMADHI